MDAGQVLNFSGGALAFAAVLFPVILRSWRRAVARGTHARVIAMLLIGLAVICLVGASVARFAYHNYLLSGALIVSYLLFASVEFLRRPWEMTRGEIIAVILLIVGAYSLLMGTIDAAGKESSPRKAQELPH